MTLSLGEVHCWGCWVELSWIGYSSSHDSFSCLQYLAVALECFLALKLPSYPFCIFLLLSISQSRQSRVPCDSPGAESRCVEGAEVGVRQGGEESREEDASLVREEATHGHWESRGKLEGKQGREGWKGREGRTGRKGRWNFQKCGQNWSWWSEWRVGHRLSLFRLRIWELSLSLVWAGEIPYGSGIFRASKSSPPSLPRRKPGENQIYEDSKTKNLNQVWAPHFRLTISAAARTKSLLLTL